MKIKTKDLQDVVSKVVKCASNNKLLPITSLVGLKIVQDDLRLITTDMVNYVIVNCPTEEVGANEADFEVTVSVDLFAKLIGKMTSQFVTLTLLDNGLEVKGNGRYLLDLPMDENGRNVRFTDPYKKFDFNNVVLTETVSLDVIHTIINSASSSLATTSEVPCYNGYYVKDSVIATDTYKIACVNVDVLSEARLLRADTINLLGMSNYDITLEFDDKGNIMCSATDLHLISRVLDGIEDFSIDAITRLLNTEGASICEVGKDELLQVLDRLTLFVLPYDRNAIKLTFADCLILDSLSSNGNESVNYLSSENLVPYECTIDVETLKSQLKAVPETTVKIQFAMNGMIKLLSDNVTQVLALLSTVE